MELDKNMHSVFLLNYHLVLVTKYRKRSLTMRFLHGRKRFLYILVRITTLHWLSGTMTKITFISCFVHIPTHRSADS